MKFKIHNIQNLFLFYICVWTISPVLAYGTTYRVLVIFSVFMWLILEMYNKKGIFKKTSLVSLFLLVYIFYSSLLVSISSSLISEIQLLVMLFFLLVYESRRNYLESLSWVFWGVLLVFPIWFYLTIKGLDSIGGHVSRVIVRSSDEAKELVNQGIGGYALVYSGVLLLPILIGLFYHLISIRNRVKNQEFDTKKFYLYFSVVSLNIVLISILLIKAGYTIALSTSFIAILIIFTMKRFSYIRITFLLFIFILLFTLQKEIIYYVSSFLLLLTEEPVYTKKINDVVLYLTTNNSTGSVDDRAIRYNQSIDVFFQNPFLGIISQEKTGGHSFILDNYARWGLGFGSLLLYFIIYIPIRALKYKKKYLGVYLAIIFVILSIFLLNTAAASFGVIIYLAVPYFYHFIKNYGIEKN